MFRASGTESITRIYAEAPNCKRVHALLEWGRGRLLQSYSES